MSAAAVSVVVPVCNEAGNLAPLHAALARSLDEAGIPFEALYVDDGSTDASWAELQALAQSDDRVRLIRFVRNYGQTAALTAGIRHARHPVLVTLDADLQNDPADIPSMIATLEQGYDVICGWRQGRQDAALSRRLPSVAANWLIARLSKVYIHDYGCTLRVYKRAYIQHIPLYGEMHRFIPIYVTWAGARIAEVPVRHHARVRGQSKYGLSRVFKVLLDLTTVKFLRDFYVTPIYFFGWLGFSLLAGGALSALAAGALLLQGGWPLAALGLGLLAPMLALFGVVEITLGIIAEVLIRMHYDIRDKAPYRVLSVRNLQTTEEVILGQEG